MRTVRTAVSCPDVSVATRPHAIAAPARASLSDYLELLKLGIMQLVLVTTVGAMAFAAQGWPATRLVAATVAGMALVAGGSSAFNHWYDRDIDRLMVRTRDRPVASGRVPAVQALAIGIGCGVVGVVELAALVNAQTALYGLAGYVVYVLVYTVWLKRRTPYNIVIGGAAGSFPPLAGWAAVTGTIDASAIALAIYLFLWTPPHFYALSLLLKDDYAEAGVPMLPVVAGVRVTARHVLVYTILLVASSLVPVALGTLGLVYAALAAVAGGWFIVLAIRLDRAPDDRALARRTFLFSIAYLAATFVAMGVDRALAGVLS